MLIMMVVTPVYGAAQQGNDGGQLNKVVMVVAPVYGLCDSVTS